MLLIAWDGTLYRNEKGLQHLRAMWKDRFQAHLDALIPVFADHICQQNLGVAGIRWTATEGDGPEPRPRAGLPGLRAQNSACRRTEPTLTGPRSAL
jgi:hypothetical protein